VSEALDLEGPKSHVAPASFQNLRVLSAGVEEVLERFSSPDLLAAGKVILISLEAIEARLGDRWELRRDQIYEFTARILERGVGADGFFLRVSPTDFFILQPGLRGVAAQAASLRYLREVLNHFLGDDGMASAGVLRVTRIANGQLEAMPMDSRAQEPGAEQTEDVPVGPDLLAAPPGAERSVSRWSPFIAADGRTLRVSAKLTPVYELKGFSRIGFRMIRRVLVVGSDEELTPAQIAKLSTADLLKVDLATIVRGIDRLLADEPGTQHLSLIVPVSFTSLSSQRGRSEFIKQLKIAATLVKLGIICEICGIDGVPPGALLAATSLVRPFTLLLMGYLLNSTPAAIGSLQGSGLKALSVECPPGLGDVQFNDWGIGVIAASRRVAKSLVCYRVSSARRAGTLASLGASHASLSE
jgi:hypothetical protein